MRSIRRLRAAARQRLADELENKLFMASTLMVITAMLRDPKTIEHLASVGQAYANGIRALSADIPSPTTGSTPATDGASPTSTSNGADAAHEASSNRAR